MISNLLENIYLKTLRVSSTKEFILLSIASFISWFILIFFDFPKNLIRENTYLILLFIIPLLFIGVFFLLELFFIIKITIKIKKDFKLFSEYKGFITLKILMRKFNLTLVESIVFMHLLEKSDTEMFYIVGKDKFQSIYNIPKERIKYSHQVFNLDN